MSILIICIASVMITAFICVSACEMSKNKKDRDIEIRYADMYPDSEAAQCINEVLTSDIHEEDKIQLTKMLIGRFKISRSCSEIHSTYQPSVSPSPSSTMHESVPCREHVNIEGHECFMNFGGTCPTGDNECILTREVPENKRKDEAVNT